MATGATTNYFLPYPLSTDPVRIAGDIEQLATRIDIILNEEIEDAAAAMWTGGTFTNGINTPTYNDSTGKMSMSLAQNIQTTASPQFVGLTLTGDIAVNGGDLTTSSTTFNLINTNATTLNIGGAATTTNIGNASGQTNFAGNVNISSGKVYEINNVSVLSNTTLGSSVINSSLTSVGTITTGTWSATTIAVNKGGTGLTSYSIGDIIYASGATTLSKLSGVATGNALISGGVGTAPLWGKIGLTTHVSGTLPVSNGGTGTTTSTGTGNVVLSASPTLTGTVTLPSTTSIGNVSSTELGYLDGVTSAIQTQLNAKAPLASPALSGTPTAPTATAGTNTTQIATTSFVQTAISAIGSLPSQTGNAGKYLTTNGTTASWTDSIDGGTP